MKRRFLGCGLMALAWVATGCGPRDGTEPTAEVTGVITLDGQPIEGVSVAFIPEEGRPASGRTDAEGRFSLSTFDAGDGAILGSHKVVLNEAQSDEEPAPDDPRFGTWKRPPPRFSKTYGDPNKSGFTADVEEGQTNEFTFEMTSQSDSK